MRTCSLLDPIQPTVLWTQKHWRGQKRHRFIRLGGQQAGQIDVIGTLQRLHCEVGAGYPFLRHVAALLNLVDAGQLLYGTNFPFGGVPRMKTTMQRVQRTPVLNGQELRVVLRCNAVGLFPRLGATG